MATLFKLVAFAVAVALAAAAAAAAAGGVSAETHHVVAGPDFNVSAWLLGRLFTVGDKLRFEYAGDEDGIVEVRGAEELLTCNLTNPIRMLTDPISHVALEEEGIRYFASGNAERCRNGMKLPVSVHRDHKYDPDEPYPPFEPDVPSPPYKPDVPSPPHEPYKIPPPPPSYPSAAARIGGAGLLAAAAWAVYGLSI